MLQPGIGGVADEHAGPSGDEATLRGGGSARNVRRRMALRAWGALKCVQPPAEGGDVDGAGTGLDGAQAAAELVVALVADWLGAGRVSQLRDALFECFDAHRSLALVLSERLDSLVRGVLCCLEPCHSGGCVLEDAAGLLERRSQGGELGVRLVAAGCDRGKDGLEVRLRHRVGWCRRWHGSRGRASGGGGYDHSLGDLVRCVGWWCEDVVAVGERPSAGGCGACWGRWRMVSVHVPGAGAVPGAVSVRCHGWACQGPTRAVRRSSSSNVVVSVVSVVVTGVVVDTVSTAFHRRPSSWLPTSAVSTDALFSSLFTPSKTLL